MPFSTSTKKMNMVLSLNARPAYYSNAVLASVASVASVGPTTTVGVLNGVGSVGGGTR